MKKVFAVVLAVLVAAPCFATSHYVRKGATGSNDGSDWTNAWNELDQINFSSVACGDTIWIGGGTYTTNLNISKTCTATSPLLIQTVLSTDSVPTSAAGYTTADLSQAVFSGNQITASCVYCTLSGRKGTSSGGTTSYGIYQTESTSGGVTAINTSGDVTWTMDHVRSQGPVCAETGNCSGSTWGYSTDSNGTDNTTFTNNYIDSYSEVLRPTQSNWTLTGNAIGNDVYVTPADHEDLIYAWGTFSGVFSNNLFFGSGNDGIFFDFNTVTKGPVVMINNVFTGWGYWAVEFGKSGSCGPFLFLNNSFLNDSLGSDGKGNEYSYGILNDGGCNLASGSLAENNIFYNTSQPTDFSDSQFIYNAGTVSGASGSFSGGTGTVDYSVASPIQSFTGFVNPWPRTGGSPSLIVPGLVNAQMTAAGAAIFQGKGANLTAQCSTYPTLCNDMDGNPRPATGAWDLGAVQYSTTSPVDYTLVTATVGTGSGTISGTDCTAGTYPGGTAITCTETPATGSTFAGWSGACTGTGACSFDLASDSNVTATFNTAATTDTLTVSKAGTGSGTLSGSNCVSGTYPTGTVVTCSEVPATGSTFTRWSGACSGTGACSFTLSANSTVTATFTLSTATTYALSTATAGTGTGTVTGCAGTFKSGTAYSCTVTPTGGSTLTSVSGCGGSGMTTFTGVMPAANCTVTATFTAAAATTYTLSTATPGTGTGTITGCAGALKSGAAYSCAVAPTGGSTLTSVAGCGGSGTTTFKGTMPAANCTVTATFTSTAPVLYTLSIAVIGHGTLTGCGGKLGAGAAYECALTPTSGSSLTGASGCGGTLSGSNYSGAMPAANCTVTATFTRKHHAR